MKRLAEMYEIWAELQTEEDYESAKRLTECLDYMQTSIIVVNRDPTFSARSETLVDEEIQTILRNLNAIPIIMNLQETLFAGTFHQLSLTYLHGIRFLRGMPGGRDSLKPEISKIMKLANGLMYHLVKSCRANQSIAFKYIHWFVERVDDGFLTSKVLRALLDGNAGEHILASSHPPIHYLCLYRSHQTMSAFFHS